MTEGYIQIMIDSLDKKLVLLDKIMEINKRQYEVSSVQPFDSQKYDEIMDEKGKLIDEINSLDEGFTSTYDIIKGEINAEPSKYRDKVLLLQELVRKAVDKGVEVEVQEKRNKNSLEASISMARKELQQKRISRNVALQYYKSSQKINNVDPQLMDKKK